MAATSQIVRLVIRVVLFAAVLRHFGPSTKGLVDVAIAVSALLAFLQLPTGQLLLSSLPGHVANEDGWSARTLLWSAYGYQNVGNVLTGVVLLIASGPVADFYNLPRLRTLLVGLGLAAFANILSGPLSRDAFVALRRNRTAIAMDMMQLAAEVAATAWVVLGNRGPLAYVVLTALAPCAGYVIGWYRWLVTFRHDFAGPADGRSAWTLARGALNFAGIVAAGNAVNALYLRLPTIVAARFVSTSDVALLTMSLSIMAMSTAVTSVPEGNVLALAAGAATDGAAAVHRILERARRAMTIYGGLVAAVTVALAPEIVRIVGGPKFADAAPVLAVAAVLPLAAAFYTYRLGLYVVNRPVVTVKLFAAITVAEALFYVVAGHFGIMGLALTRVVGQLVFAVLIVRATLRALERPSARYAWQLGILVGIVAAEGGAVALVRSSSMPVVAAVPTIALLVSGAVAVNVFVVLRRPLAETPPI